MELPPRYASLLSGSEIETWPIYAYLPASAGYISRDEAEARLRTCPGIHLEGVTEAQDGDFPKGHWALDLRIKTDADQDPDDIWEMRLFLAPAEPLSADLDWDFFTEDEKRESMAAKWEVGLDCAFGRDAATDFHFVLRILSTVCPQLVALYDDASFRVHSGAWVRDIALSSVPPSLEMLFSVHTVFPEKPEEGSLCWIHTHGLTRSGCVELEALGIPEQQVDTIADFLTQVAAQFLDGEIPDPDEPFDVGEHLKLVWLPWEVAVQKLPEGHLGTRPDRDETHVVPSGVLCVPAQGVKRRRYIGLSSCVPTLERNPIYFISETERQRSSLLAMEKWQHFVHLQRRFGRTTDWNFAVKLGFATKQTDPETPEHEDLWFEVQEIDGESVDATLVNQPHFLAGLKDGDRGKHTLENLTDWTISSPHGTFTPDLVYHLLRIVGQGEPASGR